MIVPATLPLFLCLLECPSYLAAIVAGAVRAS
jgi:hypothetical protein